MNRKAFLSYASEDRELAESVCVQLEVAGIGCWIAPRDIDPGQVYAEAIVDGIASTPSLVLLLSASANQSPHVHREVELAVSQHHPVIPIRVVEVEPAKALQYLISSTQWLDVNDRDVSDWIGDAARAITERTAGIHAAAKATLIPPRSRTFSGRDEILANVAETLRARRRVTLHGIPGVGKTALAVELAHRLADEFSYVFWLNAESLDTLIASASEATSLLALSDPNATEASTSVRLLCKWLAEEDGWLVVFDNLDSLELLHEVLPAVFRGAVLTTSRARPPRDEADESIDVGPLSRAEATGMLLRRLGGSVSPAEDEAASAIADVVGALPLALAHAAAFMEQTSTTPREYLAMYETEGAALRAERGSARESVAHTFTGLLQQADERGAAGDLMRFVAFLAPDAVPEELLTHASLLGDRLAAVETSVVSRARLIGDASRLSLVRRDPESRTLACHRIVQDVVRDQLGPDERDTWLQRAIAVIAAALPVPGYSTWPQWERLAPHALQVIDHARASEVNSEELGYVIGLVGAYLGQRGNWEASLTFSRRSLDVRRGVLAPDHIDLAWSLHNVVASTVRLTWDDPTDVESDLVGMAQEATAIAEQALDADDPDIGVFLTGLANAYRSAGNADEAESTYRRVLRHYERIEGPESPRLAFPLNLLGSLLCSQKRFEEAEDCYVDALAANQANPPPNQLSLAHSLHGLAEVRSSQGNREQALLDITGAREVAESTLGPEHPEVTTFRHTHERIALEAHRRPLEK